MSEVFIPQLEDVRNDIILLSQFHKKTQKTPLREIKKANKLMKDYLERSNENE